MPPKAAVQEQFSDDELEGLGPEERAALEADKEEDDDEDLDDDPDDDPDLDSGEEEEEDPDGDGDPEPEPEKEKKPAKADEADADEESDDDGDGDGEEGKPAPRPAVGSATYKIDDKAVTDAKKVLDGIEAEYDALGEKFSEGDIDESTYHKENRALQRKEQAASKVIDRAEIYQDLNQSNKTNDLASAQKRFFADPSNKFFDDDLTFPSLQAALEQVSADPKFQDVSYDDMLAEAGKRAKKRFGHPDVDPDDVKEKGKGKTPAQEKIDERRKAKSNAQSVVDKTLSDKTAAGKDDKGYAGKFDHLDSLSGMDLEQAIAAMSEDDQRAWAEMQ